MSKRAESSDTPRESPLGDTVPETDRRLFELLDQYVDHLHQDDLTSRSVLLERHPELMELLHCLESLDSLAIAPVPSVDSDDKTPFVPADGSDADTARTVLWNGGLAGPPGDDDSVHDPSSETAQDGGTEFGKYVLQEELGRGGMGVVYRAWQADLRRHVAIKMILQSRLASADDVRRFHIEAQSAGGLTHAGIVGIHEVGQVGGQHYFTMEYIEGDNLAARLKRKAYEPDEAAKCVADVARAVHYLHEHGVIHRDLKPSNILLDSEGRPHVTDFGLAKIFDGTDSGQTQSGTIVGTPSYMSPEQAAGRVSKVSPLCDVYSLGAILYELLSGRPPFQRGTPLDTLVDVIESEPSLLCKENPSIPRDLELICFKCLEKDPQKRYTSAGELAEDLERYLRREDIDARPAGFVSKLKRWARREPALVSRLAGVAAAAGIVHIRYFFRDDVTPWEHYQFMVLFGVCALLAFVFQRMMHRDSLADVARYGWAASDVIVLTSLLYLAEMPIGPVLIGYPLIIASAGLFFMVRLVLFTTVLSLMSFAILIWARSPSIFDLESSGERSHYLLIFAAVLAVQGLITAYQVYRVRALSQFYEQRQI